MQFVSISFSLPDVLHRLMEDVSELSRPRKHGPGLAKLFKVCMFSFYFGTDSRFFHVFLACYSSVMYDFWFEGVRNL